MRFERNWRLELRISVNQYSQSFFFQNPKSGIAESNIWKREGIRLSFTIPEMLLKVSETGNFWDIWLLVLPNSALEIIRPNGQSLYRIRWGGGLNVCVWNGFLRVSSWIYGQFPASPAPQLKTDSHKIIMHAYVNCCNGNCLAASFMK